MQNRKPYSTEPSSAVLDWRKLLTTASAVAIVLVMAATRLSLAQTPPATESEAAAALTAEIAEVTAARREGIFVLSPLAEASPYDGVEKLKKIPELVSSNGRLDVDLTVSEEKHTIKTSEKEYPLLVRSYVAAGVPEQGMWAPTLRVKPNDRLTLTIHNRLPPDSPLPPPDCKYPPTHGDHNFPHAFNVTNMHTHGLHVSPYEDDIFREVPPSFSSRYTYELDNHPPGTHWYHPHVHGATAMQVANGMAGVLIVEPEAPEFPGIEEQVLIFNQFAFDDKGAPPYRLDTFRYLWDNGTSALGTTINGQVKPTIDAVAGKVVRWRLVNAGFNNAVRFIIQKEGSDDALLLHQIATDGIFLPKVRKTKDIALGPGNRVDLFIRFDEAETYHIRPRTYKPEYEYDFEGAPKRPILGEAKSLATIKVSKGSGVQPIPETLPDSGYKIPDVPSSQTYDLRFTIVKKNDEKPGCPDYWRAAWGVNGERFNPRKIPVQPKLGTVEEWTLSADQFLHPFHIHVNPFLVTELNGKKLSPPMWKDTVIVGPTAKAKILNHFVKFTGDFVLHCHFLAHEDVGMMQRVRIVP